MLAQHTKFSCSLASLLLSTMLICQTLELRVHGREKNHRPWESVKIFVHRWMSLFSSTRQCWLISKRQCFRARSQHSSSSRLLHSPQLNFAGRNAWDRSRPWMISFANYIIILTCIIRHKNRQKIPSDSLFCARTMNILIFLCLEFEFAFFARAFQSMKCKKNCNKLFFFIWNQIKRFLRLHIYATAGKKVQEGKNKNAWRNIWSRNFNKTKVFLLGAGWRNLASSGIT